MEKFMSKGYFDLGKLDAAYPQGEIDLCFLLKIALDESIHIPEPAPEFLKWSDPQFIHEILPEICKCKESDALHIIETILSGNVSWMQDWITGCYLHETCIDLLKQIGSENAKSVLKRYLEQCNHEVFHSLDRQGLGFTTWGALQKGFNAAAELGVSGLDELVKPYFRYGLMGNVAKALAIMYSDDAIETLVNGLEYIDRHDRYHFDDRVFDVLKTLDRMKLIDSLTRLYKKREIIDEHYEQVMKDLGIEVPLEVYMDDSEDKILQKMREMKAKDSEHAMRVALSYVHETGSIKWLKNLFDFSTILPFGLSQIEDDLVSVITTCSILSKYPDVKLKSQLEQVLQTIPQYYPPLVALLKVSDRDSMNAVFEWVYFQMKNNSFGKDLYDFDLI